jgi:hypothetical protein
MKSLYVIDIANRTLPVVRTVLPLGLTASGRGSGHIANFVKPDCTARTLTPGP